MRCTQAQTAAWERERKRPKQISAWIGFVLRKWADFAADCVDSFAAACPTHDTRPEAPPPPAWIARRQRSTVFRPRRKACMARCAHTSKANCIATNQTWRRRCRRGRASATFCRDRCRLSLADSAIAFLPTPAQGPLGLQFAPTALISPAPACTLAAARAGAVAKGEQATPPRAVDPSRSHLRCAVGLLQCSEVLPRDDSRCQPV